MRIRLIASGAVIALVVAACGGSEHDEKSAPRTTAASAPTTTVAPAAGLQVGDRVGPKGTQLLAPSSPDTRQIDPEQACRTFVETPGGQCDIVMMAGGNALWTLGALPGTGTGEQVWHVRIRARSKSMPDGGWDVALALPQTPDPLFANASVKSADVTGDGRPELLVGYRSGGTGQFEAYAVVTYDQGKQREVA